MRGIKNIVLITVDCLRADHLGCMGYKKETTPNIDRLAGEGILFTECIANGTGTPATISSILTSTYPFMYGGYEKIAKNRIMIQETEFLAALQNVISYKVVDDRLQMLNEEGQTLLIFTH